MTEINTHLLGWVPKPYDERDWKLEDFLSDDPLQSALAVLLNSHRTSPDVKPWATLVTKAIQSPEPPPSPEPPTPTGEVIWKNDSVLDQGDTPHCEGFAWAGWGNCEPVVDNFTNDDGNAIYYECKVIDGEPNKENGSDTRSGAKAMKDRGRLNAYAFADTLETAEAWIKAKGSIVVGTYWMYDMFKPDANGYVVATGGTAGGHAYVWKGILENGDYVFHQSWGEDWGKTGTFYMTKDTFSKLFEMQGDACTAIELPSV